MQGNFTVGKITVALVFLGMAVSVFIGDRSKSEPESLLGLVELVPDTIGTWNRSGQPPVFPQSDLEFLNEFYQGVFREPDGRAVSLMIEYGSDSRRRHEVHLPEYCHRARGDVIRNLPELKIEPASSQPISVGLIEWEYPRDQVKALCAYWLIVGGRYTTDVWELKFEQFFSGILSKPKGVVLVRVDAFYSPESPNDQREERIAAISAFVRAFLESAPAQTRAVLFGQDTEK